MTTTARRPRWTARVRPRVLEIIWLTLVWVLLWGTFTPLSIVGGVVVAVAVIGAFRFPPAEAHLPVRPLRLLGLVGYLFYDMVVSGAEVSWQVLRYGPAARGAVFEVPLLSGSDRVVTVVARTRCRCHRARWRYRSTMRTGCGSSTRWARGTRPGWSAAAAGPWTCSAA